MKLTIRLSILLFATFFVLNCSDEEEARTQVYISDQSLQCFNPGVPIKQSSKLLTDADIQVFEANCGILTGVAFPTVCGADTGNIHLFLIEETNVDNAENLDFRSVKSLASGIGYDVVGCKNG